MVIDTDLAPCCLSCILEDVDVEPKGMAKRLCGRDGTCIIRGDKGIAQIFSELCNTPENYRKGFIKSQDLGTLAGTERHELSGLQTKSGALQDPGGSRQKKLRLI